MFYDEGTASNVYLEIIKEILSIVKISNKIYNVYLDVDWRSRKEGAETPKVLFIFLGDEMTYARKYYA